MSDALEAYGHLPLVRLGSSGERRFAGGELVELRFDEWRLLDDEFPFADRQFEQARPAFYLERMTRGDELQETIDRFGESIGLVHRALLLATAASLPAPEFSVWYLHAREAGSTQRWIGPFEREYLLYRDEPAVVLDDEGLAHARAVYALLARADAHGVSTELAGAFDALTRTARPDFGPMNAFVHSMIALEDLLLPDVRRQLGATFARRGAPLLAGSSDELDGAAEWFRRLYSVRSAALHGERTIDDTQFFAAGRATLVHVLLHALAYCTVTGRDPAHLREELDALPPDRFEAFREHYAGALP